MYGTMRKEIRYLLTLNYHVLMKQFICTEFLFQLISCSFDGHKTKDQIHIKG